MEHEEWSDIAGYEGLYQISNYGEIKSSYTNKILKPNHENTGYLTVALYKSSKVRRCKIHRIVAETFIANEHKKPVVNHKNGDKTDNRVQNLEWATHKENMQHAFATGLKVGVNHPNNKKSIPVAQYDKNMNFVKLYPSINEAGRNGFRTEEICKCCKGKKKTTGGYIWRYAYGGD